MKKLISLLAFVFAQTVLAQQLNITYIANEGVLIESGEDKVLIDALFNQYGDAYLFPSEATINSMNEGEIPFDQIDLVLSTHVHRDHFEPQTMGNYLQQQKRPKLIAPNEVKVALETEFENFSSIESRVISHNKTLKILSNEVNGVSVEAFFIDHSGTKSRNIENLGFIVEVGGKRVLHLGDANVDPERYNDIDLTQYNIDVAMIPYWYLTDAVGVKIIHEKIKPKHLIAIHFPKVGSPMMLKAIAKNFPEAVVFQKSMEKVRY